MDSIARAVRQAHHQQASDRLTGRAPAVVLHDGGYQAIGGELVARALVRRICGGSKGLRSVSVCISEQCGASAAVAADNDVEIDGHSYPAGVALFEDPDALQARIKTALEGQSSGLGPGKSICATIGSNGNPTTPDGGSSSIMRVVAIDGGISCLMRRHGTRRIASLVDAVRRNPNTYCVILGCVHNDMHNDEHEVSLLCQDPIAEAHILPEGRIVVKVAASKGRKRTERISFDIADGDVAFDKEGDRGAPSKAPPPPGLVSTDENTSQTSKPSKPSKASQTSRISERAEAERKAKGNVVLPYERQGHARVYAADADFREYLPVEAGGWMRHGSLEDSFGVSQDGTAGTGATADRAVTEDIAALERTTHRLGTIHYLRGESDDESFDSDEDPDDDIDI